MCVTSKYYYSGQDSNHRATLFFTICMQHIALAAATGKSCLQYFVNFAVLFLHSKLNLCSFRKIMWRAPTPKPLLVSRAFGECVPSLNPPHGPSPYHRTWIRHWWLWSCISNKSSKKVYWWHFAHCHSRFSADILTECKNLVSRFDPREIMVSLV